MRRTHTDTEPRLTVPQIAAMVGIQPSTFRAYVARGKAPKPDGRYGRQSPYWFPSTIAGWMDERTTP